jgi:hypothetical protein
MGGGGGGGGGGGRFGLPRDMGEYRSKVDLWDLDL